MPTPLWIGGSLENREVGGEIGRSGDGGKPRGVCHITAFNLAPGDKITKSCKMAKEGGG